MVVEFSYNYIKNLIWEVFFLKNDPGITSLKWSPKHFVTISPHGHDIISWVVQQRAWWFDHWCMHFGSSRMILHILLFFTGFVPSKFYFYLVLLIDNLQNCRNLLNSKTSPIFLIIYIWKTVSGSYSLYDQHSIIQLFLSAKIGAFLVPFWDNLKILVSLIFLELGIIT